MDFKLAHMFAHHTLNEVLFSVAHFILHALLWTEHTHALCIGAHWNTIFYFRSKNDTENQFPTSGYNIDEIELDVTQTEQLPVLYIHNAADDDLYILLCAVFYSMCFIFLFPSLTFYAHQVWRFKRTFHRNGRWNPTTRTIFPANQTNFQSEPGHSSTISLSKDWMKKVEFVNAFIRRYLFKFGTKIRKCVRNK